MIGDPGPAVSEPSELPIWKKALNFVGFQIGWFACILGAANGRAWVGPVFVALLFSVHLFLEPKRRREVRLALVAAVFGILFDSIFAATGLLVYAGSLTSWLSPPWLIAMWVNFAMTLRSSMSWLLGRPLLAVASGVVFGPLAYLAGARLGAVIFSVPSWMGIAGLAVAWGIAIPLLMKVATGKDR
jgi:hypothetical protein